MTKLRCIRCDEPAYIVFKRHQESETFRCDNCGQINVYYIVAGQPVSKI